MRRMNVHHSFGSLAVATALTAWFVAVAAQQPAQQPPAQPPAGQQPARQPGNQTPGQSGNQTPGQPGNQTPGQPGNQTGPPAAQTPPAPKPAIPAAASSIAQRPDDFYGQNVSVYATVERQLTPTAFAIDQDPKGTGKEVIVLARRLHEKVEPGAYITVIGEVVRADSAEIAKVGKDVASSLPPEVLAEHAGKPFIVATAVVTTALNDIAKFIPPPMTPEEEVLDKAMKSVGPANGALRKGVDAANAELVKTNTAILAKAFAETETFWKSRNNAEAVKIAQTARSAVDTIAKAAAMGNWNEAKAQNATLNQQCASCHKSFRERLEDGSFAVRRDGTR
jgi:cytochrome c556